MKTLAAGSFRYDSSIDIPAPPEAVWRVLADYDRDGEWREGVTMRCEPAGLVEEGTRTFETLRAFGGEHRRVASIDRVEPGRSFRFRGEDGSFEGTRTVERTNDGSRVRVTLEVTLQGLLRLFAPLVGWLFERRVRRDLRRLRALVTTLSSPRHTEPDRGGTEAPWDAAC